MPTDSALLQTLQTLAIGAAGAGLFWAVGFPAYPLTGPATAVSAATLLGAPTLVPPVVRDAVFVVIGLSIGSTVTPDVLGTALAWPVSFGVLVVTLAAIVLVARAVLHHGFRYARSTATLAAMPGHLSFVLALSTELKADVPRIALVQTVRVLLLTLLVPVLIVLWGVEGTSRPCPRPDRSRPSRCWRLFLAGARARAVCQRLRVPAALLIAGMAVSAIGHGSDADAGAVPGAGDVWPSSAWGH